MEPKKELILVYNANSGFFNVIKDALHKSISPSTYACNLCGLTYGTIRMKSQWKIFIDNLSVPSKFLHKDEFYKMLKAHPHKVGKTSFPAIYLPAKGNLALFISSEQINKINTLPELMNLIETKLQETQ